jgi:hypothetical protein
LWLCFVELYHWIEYFLQTQYVCWMSFKHTCWQMWTNRRCFFSWYCVKWKFRKRDDGTNKFIQRCSSRERKKEYPTFQLTRSIG